MSTKQNKKKTSQSLGRFLIKDRFKNQPRSKHSKRHTTELDDGQNYNRIDFNSVTEQTDVDDFLTNAELARNNFKAEKLNAKIVVPTSQLGLLTAEERERICLIQNENKEHVRIPRRPPWDRSMDTEDLNESERAAFLAWRRSLALLQEKEGIILTPYEKNLQFWRQLWRVIERSDVVIQIVDARNPLLFRCEDLEMYVKEVDENKENLLLVNKADFLTEKEREIWANYFREANINALFYSATLETVLEQIEEEEEEEDEYNDALSTSSYSSSLYNDCEDSLSRLNVLEAGIASETDHQPHDRYIERDEVLQKEEEESVSSTTAHASIVSQTASNLAHCDISSYVNSSKLLNREELIEVLTYFYTGPKLNSTHITIGLVGYPNVGKSSTINSLMREKKVSVSATPGKTKHFQTMFLTDQVLLCDCPGLVFPAFVCTKEEMVISGILPIDEMRHHVPPMNLVLSLIPRDILERSYGVKIPPPPEGEVATRSPTSEEFLTVYGHMRGFMTQRGIPDHPRSARYILKDYINGKLLFCHSPPGVLQESYHDFVLTKIRKVPTQQTPQQLSLVCDNRAASIDAHISTERTRSATITHGAQDEKYVQKPWRMKTKLKRNSRQKLRIKFAHLDQ